MKQEGFDEYARSKFVEIQSDFTTWVPFPSHRAVNLLLKLVAARCSAGDDITCVVDGGIGYSRKIAPDLVTGAPERSAVRFLRRQHLFAVDLESG